MTIRAQRVGPYEILEPLGQGGMGIVFRAAHSDTGHQVALKTVLLPHSGLLHSLRREIRLLARLQHPDIVRIVDDGVEEGLPWYAMELIHGVTLRRFARNQTGGQDKKMELEIASSELIQDGSAALAGLPSWGSQSEAAKEMFVKDDDPTTLGRTSPGAPPWWTEMLDGDSAFGPSAVTYGQTELPGGETTPTHLADGSGERLRPDPRKIPDGPQVNKTTWRTRLRLIQRLCVPLSFLHGEGVVHRDLKPENVIVRPNGWPALVDFGLFSRFGDKLSRESLEVEEGNPRHTSVHASGTD